jgi:hypothetical protein
VCGRIEAQSCLHADTVIEGANRLMPACPVEFARSIAYSPLGCREGGRGGQQKIQ